MNATTAAISLEPKAECAPPKGVVAMACLIIAESAIFTIFVVAYLFYIGKSLTGPSPRDVLELPIVNTICLLSSSITITIAVRALKKGDTKQFSLWWVTTVALGAYFLFGTAHEWHRLIYEKGLTIQTNLFGTTFYSLVGLHASHVLVGLVAMLTVMSFAMIGSIKQEHAGRAHVLALYWHFVDAVWIIVFTVVYIIGR